MRTTLDLPADVANVLRLESARRGGRKRASITALVSDAVRKTYGSAPAVQKSKHDLTPGRVVIGSVPDAPPITSEDVRAALYD